MKKFSQSILILLFLVSFTFGTEKRSQSELFSYIEPKPGAEYVKNNSTIIFKPAPVVDLNSIKNSKSVTISGSIRGNYEFSQLYISNENVFILKPAEEFVNNEEITVSFLPEIRCTNGVRIEPFVYSFRIQKEKLPVHPLAGLVNEIPEARLNELLNTDTGELEGFPEITVNYSNNPAPGKIILSNIVFNVQIPNTPHLIIMNNDASTVFSRQMGGQIFDFNRQPNGRFTYFSRVRGKYFELDTNYNLVDSFYTGNGYLTDIHELRVLPNRHALLMSYDKQYIDMSLLIQGGNPNALVTGLIIQEIDENKNVVFQWRSWDHIPITDATHENLLAPEIDYIHGNAIELDNDGNIMISSRHLDEITKINRSTGNIIWRLGGKMNEFQFPNDPLRFSYQHGIRRLLNGNIILFDNGNYHSPQQSRAVEYMLDETSKIATMVWEYKNTPQIYGNAMGFAQRLENGNTLISWGSTNPTMTEVKPDGSKALEISFSTGVFSYRVFKYNWGGNVTGIQPVNNEIPNSFSLLQNYPNPFNPVTKIRFSIPAAGGNSQTVSTLLTVYDMLGKEVQVLTDKQLRPGNYEVDFAAGELSSGIYFYKLTAGNFTDMKKMVLVK
ncbi:MAG: T9SS type A sorting domain-containing protein [Ignavibacteria bacterium]|nr:T9SS type A sorting domain-containing protein [Ignavibacteria bacterium]